MAEDEENLVKGDAPLNDNGIFVTSRTFKLKPGPQSSLGFHIRSKTNVTVKQKFWSKWVQYLHITVLYLLVIVLYAELRSTKRNVYDFNLNMLNLSTKHMELELSCFRELETIRGVLAGLSSGLSAGASAPARQEDEGESLGLTKQDIVDEGGEANRKKRSPSSVVYSDADVLRLDSSPSPEVRRGSGAVIGSNSSGGAQLVKRSSLSMAIRPSRGKKGGKRRSYRLSKATHFVHLIGGHPEIVTRDGGLIAPWFVDKSAAGEFGFTNQGFNMREGKGVVEVGQTGLYLLYAQVYYMTSSPLNSYSMMVQPKANGHAATKGNDLVMSTCSAYYGGSGEDSGEISCYTSVVRRLGKGDRIYLHQRERNRVLLFRPGQSFLGMVLLAKGAPA